MGKAVQVKRLVNVQLCGSRPARPETQAAVIVTDRNCKNGGSIGKNHTFFFVGDYLTVGADVGHFHNKNLQKVIISSLFRFSFYHNCYLFSQNSSKRGQKINGKVLILETHYNQYGSVMNYTGRETMRNSPGSKAYSFILPCAPHGIPPAKKLPYWL